MTFRFRRSLKFGGVKLNVTKNGISSISLGGRGASLNIPVGRSGGIRGTVGLPGSGLSYSREFKAFSQKMDLDDQISSNSREFKAFSQQMDRSNKLRAANIENRKMIGPIFAAFGGLLLLVFVVGAIGATFSTTEPGGSTPQTDCSMPNAWMYSEQCTTGDGRETLN